VFVAEAEERRLLAEERLARAHEDLRRARSRAASAHEAAALLDDSVGKHAAAATHRREAQHDRDLAQGDGGDDV
jgi:hypothetical protein